MKQYPVNEQYIKPIGRVKNSEHALWMCYSATGVSFVFTGKQLKIHILGDDRCENEGMDGNLARVKIFVDENVIWDAMISAKNTVADVLNLEESETHRIEVLKVSETAMSTCGIAWIETDENGIIQPTARKKHCIEFAGDSITCGYGVDDEVAEHNFKTDTEDATKAYAYLTAQALGAEHSLVSISGYGIISGYSGDGIRRADQLLPTYYEKMGFSYGSFGGVYPQNVRWDFSAFQPDLIVINLGTNDDSYTQDDPALQNEYCETYQQFLKTIRRNNPQAKLLCMLGIMGERLCPMVEKAVNDYKNETGDSNVLYAHFTEQKAEDGRAADWHPSQLTHRKAAEKLTAIIKDYMNW